MKNQEQLWKAMDSLRAIDYVKYVNEILTFTFVRYLEDKESKSYWSEINPDEDINKQLDSMFNQIEQDHEDLNGLFTQIPLQKLKPEEYKIIRYSINQMDIKKESAPSIFQFLLYALSDAGGRSFGHHTTPESINKLFSEVLDVKNGNVYDGTVGSGQLLIEIGKKAREKQDIKLWGQEIHQATAGIAKMNMIINDFTHEIAVGDVLVDPKFTDNNKLKTFDYVAMEFPFSVNWKGLGKDVIEYDKYGRFEYGIPPKSKGDMLFIQHAIASLNSNGKGVLLSTPGTLFWGGSNQKIRQNLIDYDLIEAVILLPGNLLNGTSIPTSVLIINKNKPESRKEKIQLINAEEIIGSIKSRRGRSIEVEDKKIQKIIEIYRNFSEEKNISVILDNKEIEDANLSFSNYSQFIDVDSILGKVEVNRKQFEKKFQDIARLTNLGKIYRGVSTTTEAVETSQECYIIQPSDIQNNELRVSDLKKVFLDSEQIKDYLVKEGDIALTSRGKSIKVVSIPKTDEKIVLSQNMIGFRPDVEEVDSNYLQMYLTSPIGMAYLSTNQSSAIMTTLNIKDLETVPVPMIDLSEQKSIGEMKKMSDKKLRDTVKKAEEAYKEKQKEIYSKAGFDTVFQLTK